MTLVVLEMGNKEDFENLIERFTYFIQAHIQKFNPQRRGIDPEDIVQEVRIKLWKLMTDEKTIHNHSSYIKKIVDSTVIDQLRKSRRIEGIINSERQKHISEQKKIYNMYDQDNIRMKETINIALQSLLESRRRVVKLFLLNMSIEEIAILLSWTKDKTRNLIYRGLSDLKKKLKNNGIDYENK
jgi:RNA polymerase sigma-70 factor, ECF subfamily